MAWARSAGQAGEPVPIERGGNADRVACELTFGEPVRILVAALDQRVHQGVPVAGLETGHLTDLIAVVAQSFQQDDRAGREVSSPTALPIRR